MLLSDIGSGVIPLGHRLFGPSRVNDLIVGINAAIGDLAVNVAIEAIRLHLHDGRKHHVGDVVISQCSCR